MRANEFQVTARLCPIFRPNRGIVTTREIDDIFDIQPVRNQGGRGGDRRPLAVLGQRGFWLERQVERFDTGTVEAAAVDGGPGTACW